MAYNRRIKDNKKRKESKPKRNRRYMLVGLVVLAIIAVSLFAIRLIGGTDKYQERTGDLIEDTKPLIDVRLLTVNPNSRPGTETQRIKGIVIHYTANPGSTAIENRGYFEGLKDNGTTQASSHFVVGLEGEIVQCIPTWEVAYASNNRNDDTVSIECCHPGESGEFNQATYDSVIELTAWLCLKFDLDESDVIRHYDISGKNCPKYFVENPQEWDTFKKDVKKTLEKMKN